MDSPRETERPAVARHPKRLRVDALERHAQALLAPSAGGRPAMLAVDLKRGDRARALAQRPDTLEVLATLLDRVESTLRDTDRYAVVSISELWIVLADAPSEAIVRLACRALSDRLSGFYEGRADSGETLTVTVETTVGGAWIDQPITRASGLVESAMRACVAAGRAEDRIAVVRADEDRTSMRARLESRVRRALENNEVEVWYQPQVLLKGRRCESVEALIRWPQPDGSPPPLNPAQLVQTCEEIGLIGELTRRVLNSTLRHLMTWNAMGLRLQVGVNLSALTLEDADFPTQVAQACDTWGVDPSQLLFELTEGSIARNERTTIEFMHRLRELGCALSIDDFGTGYSSFSYLRQFPVHELKIDRAFVRELPQRTADRDIVRVLIEVAHVFGLRALAEGVEDAESVAILEQLGCDAIQGWYFAKAMPAQALPEWLAAHEAATVREAASETA